MTGGAKTLYKEPENKKIAGVCAGLSTYLDVDVTLIRVLAIVSLFFGLLGGIAYVAFWILLDDAPATSTTA